MKAFVMLCVLVAAIAGDRACSAEAPLLLLSDFQDDADLKKWSQGDSGAVEQSVAPRNATDNNRMMKVVFNTGDYPGFSYLRTPKDWSLYEALSFVVWTESPFNLLIRIDDSKSTDFKSRFNKTVPLEKGRNLVQIKVEEVARVLNVKDMKSLIIFTSKPPKGLTLWFDDFVLGPGITEKVPFIPYAERKDLQPKLEIVTPHFPFAKGLAGGPLNAFIVSGVTFGREVPELMQRLDLNVSLMTWDRAWDQNTWGIGDFYGQRGHAFDRVLMQKYLASSLQGPEKFHVMMMPTPIGWKEFPKGAREALLKRVKDDGEGLVLVQPFPGEDKWPADLSELSALINCESDVIDPASGYIRSAKAGTINGGKWKAAGEHMITRGVPLDALPFESMSYVKYTLAPGATAIVVADAGDPIVAVKQLGKGRVVTCAWRGSMLTPATSRGADSGDARPYRYQEVFYSLIGRCALWAAGRELQSAGEGKALESKFPDDCLSAAQSLDPQGKVTDWSISFTPPGADGVAVVPLSAPKNVTRGEDIKVSFQLPDALMGKGIAWSVALEERCAGASRTLESAAIKDAEKDIAIGFSSARVRQILAIARLKGMQNGKMVARGQAEVVVTPTGSSWDDFEVFMWPVDGLPFLRETEDVLMRQAGSTGVMDTGWGQAGHLMRWSRAGLRVLPHNVDVRPLHIRPHEFAAIARQYKDTGDKKFLIRNPSYADPEFLDKAKQKARDAATLLKPYHIPAYVLCDEPSLTSYRDEFDFDFHPKNIELFRAALEKKFGAVADLNTALGTAAANFEEIVPPTTAEARKSGNWSLWNEWRAHNDSVMADGYRMYRDAIREVDPQGRISISGTQVANPFDGFDWVKLSPLFDAMSGYGYGDQERTRMSFHPGAIKNATPAGYGAKGRTVPYQVWNALADHGCGHVLFWWVSFRNPDLTFCQSALDYQKMFNEMRNGIGRQYQLGARHKSPVAVLYSMNAMRAAWTRGQFGEWSSALAGVTSALVAQGLDPVYVSDEQIAGGDLERRGIKAVFLPMPVSLGRGGKKGSVDVAGGLLKFAGAGGLVVATHDPVCDEFLREAPVDPDLLKKIRKFDDVKAQPGAVLAEVGVKPYVSVQRAEGGLVPGLSVAVHKLGGNLPAYIVTLTRKPVGQKEVIGGDGVVSYVPDASGGNEIEKCVIDVSALGKGTATVFRADKIQTTQNGTLNLDMPGGDGLPISVLPYALKGIDVSQKIERRNLLITWQLQRSDGGKDFAPHALRISIRDEKNAEDPALSQNVTSNASGSGSIEIPLAQEDSGRKLDVQIKDVLTGTMAAAPLIVP